VALACLHPSRVQSICAIDVAPATYTWDDSDILSVRNVMRVISTTDPTIFQNRAEATRALLEHIPVRSVSSASVSVLLVLRWHSCGCVCMRWG